MFFNYNEILAKIQRNEVVILIIRSCKKNGISLYLEKLDGYSVNYVFNGNELSESFEFDSYKDAIKAYQEMETGLLDGEEA